MKTLLISFFGLISFGCIHAQDLTDALRYSSGETQGTARFKALSGAFGALGGDLSGVSLNPAGAAEAKALCLWLIVLFLMIPSSEAH
jgi:hypothetical protein